jgi:lipopolysaccharide export system ATP-binding protein
MPDLSVTEGDAGLQVRNLRKSYKKRLVIRDVSMRLNRGEVVALLGPNGSGKTTCFYSIAGLVTPEGGQVLIDGRDVTALPMYRRARLGIGYLPQEVSIFRGLSVEENIMAVLEIAVPEAHRRRERLEELISEFNITHIRRAQALALSGGERRGIGVLITDHNVRETLEIVDRAYILHDGTVLMSGTTDEIVRDETVRRVYLGQNFRMT